MPEPKVFRTKPAVTREVLAMQWDGSEESQAGIVTWGGGKIVGLFDTAYFLEIHGPGVKLRVDPGDWVIELGPGSFIPCKADQFADNYEPLAATHQSKPDPYLSGDGERLEEIAGFIESQSALGSKHPHAAFLRDFATRLSSEKGSGVEEAVRERLSKLKAALDDRAIHAYSESRHPAPETVEEGVAEGEGDAFEIAVEMVREASEDISAALTQPDPTTRLSEGTGNELLNAVRELESRSVYLDPPDHVKTPVSAFVEFRLALESLGLEQEHCEGCRGPVDPETAWSDSEGVRLCSDCERTHLAEVDAATTQKPQDEEEQGDNRG